MTYTDIVGLLNGSLGVVIMFGVLLIKMMRLEHRTEMRFKDIDHTFRDIDRTIKDIDRTIKDIGVLMLDLGRRITNLENKSKEQP